MKFNWGNFLRLLNPVPAVGGLEISDTFLRFLVIEGGGRVVQASLRLPPGIISDGKVVSPPQLTAALIKLREQVGRKSLLAVVTIGANHIYEQVFTLPYLASGKLQEAAMLNMQMISPLGTKNVYSDWQLLSETPAGGQVELLGAFIESAVADSYLAALKAAEFTTVALEFVPLSLLRVIKAFPASIQFPKTFIALFVAAEGLNFVVIRNTNLYFNHFVQWRENIPDLLTSELNRVVNFVYSRWGELINSVVLISPAVISAITDTLKSLNFNVQNLATAAGAKENPRVNVALPNRDTISVAPPWLLVLGAALRGLMPRADDTFISLTQWGTEIEYQQQRLFYLVVFWRNFLLVTLSIVFLAALAAHLFLGSISGNLGEQVAGSEALERRIDIETLQEKARAFNSVLNQALAAKRQNLKWSALFNQLWGLTGQSIVLKRLHFDPGELTVVLGGDGPSEIEVINFKNRLAKQENFENVILPLSQIVRSENRVSFQMSLKAK